VGHDYTYAPAVQPPVHPEQVSGVEDQGEAGGVVRFCGLTNVMIRFGIACRLNSV
jgi:hypothetical protein